MRMDTDDDYVGSDGNVVMTRRGTSVIATELATCKQLWELSAGGYLELEQIGPALVKHTSTEITGFGEPG